MAPNPFQHKTPPAPEQTEVNGWTVLTQPQRSPTNASEASEVPDIDILPDSRKRKANKPATPSRSAKSPRPSTSGISAGSARPAFSASQSKHSLPSFNASQPNTTRTGVGAGRRDMDPKVSASQPVPSGSRSSLDNRNFPPVNSKNRTRLHTSKSTSSLPAGSSNSHPASRSKPMDLDERSSSDSLPDPLQLISHIPKPSREQNQKEVDRKGKGKAVDRSQTSGEVPTASLSSVTRPKESTSQKESKPSGSKVVDDHEILVISSDSDNEPQFTPTQVRRTRHSQSGTGISQGSQEIGKAKAKGTKALGDSDETIDLTSDVDESRPSKSQPVEPEEPGTALRVSSKAKLPNEATSSEPIATATGFPKNSAGRPFFGATKRPAQPFTLPKPTNDLEDDEAPVGGVQNQPSASNLKSLPPKRRAPPGVKNLTTPSESKVTPVLRKRPGPRSTAQTRQSLSDAILVSLGGTASSKYNSSLPRSPTERGRRGSLLKASQLEGKPAPSSVQVEVIDLCSDSDEAMDIDDPHTTSAKAQTTSASEPESSIGATQSKGKGPTRHRSYALPSPRSSPLSMPITFSSIQHPSPPPLSSSPRVPPTSSSDGYRSGSVIGGGAEAPAAPAYNSEATSTPPRSMFEEATSAVNDIFRRILPTPSAPLSVAKDAPESSSTKGSLSRGIDTSAASLTSQAISDVSNRRTYRPEVTDLAVKRSQPFELAQSSTENLTEELVAPVSDLHLQTPDDDAHKDIPDPIPMDDNVAPDSGSESMVVDTLGLRNGSQASLSGRASPAASSATDAPAATRSEVSGPSIQRARKTARTDDKRAVAYESESTRRSGTPDQEDADMDDGAPVTSPSGRRVFSVKEPDFSELRADIPDALSDSDGLAAAIKWPAEKVPTRLHDMINRLPKNYHHNPQMKHVFESMMEENTADDEPTSPRIEILGGKTGPICPPWEFYYTNKILHGQGVPRTSKKHLKGCDCEGPCDPKSKTCACVKRQMSWVGHDKSLKGFLYNKKGKLLHPGYPIFECNDACECSEDCMNRAIQHGRQHKISIVLTKAKGWGVFADEKIPRGTYLGIYSGEMILESESEERGMLYDKYGRTYLFDLDFFHLKELRKDQKKLAGSKSEGPSTSQATASDKDDDQPGNIYSIDAFHVGNFTRFINHSCDPNCGITPSYVNEPDPLKPMLTVFTERDVKPGEELCFSYLGQADDDDEEEEEEVDEHGQTKKKVAGPSTHMQSQAVHAACLCGAANCRGKMWK